MFRWYPVVIFLVIALRFVWPLKIRLTARLATGFFIGIVALYPVMFRALGISPFNPEVNSTFLIVLGWLYMSCFFLMGLVLARDVFLLVTWPVRRGFGEANALFFAVFARLTAPVVLFCMALAIAAYGVWQGVRVPDSRTVEISLPALPPELDGFTIAHMADLHASPMLKGPRVQGVVDAMNAMNADIVLISGDVVDGLPEVRKDDVAPLAQLSAPLGVYAVTGNHEYYSSYAAWMKKFAELGVVVLSNSHTVIEKNGARFVLAGVTDEVAARFAMPLPDIDAALSGAPDTLPIILLEHRPGFAAKNAAAGVDLQLSGHTHGGLVRGLDYIIGMFNGGYYSGLYHVDGMELYVSNGAGLWLGFSARVGVPSEVTKIILRKR